MNESNRYGGATEAEIKSRMKLWVGWCCVFVLLYGGMLIVEALFFGGDGYAAIISMLASIPVPVFATIVYSKYPTKIKAVMYTAVISNVIFLVFGTYLKEMEFYYFVMLMALGIVMTMKNYRLLVQAAAAMFVINVLYIAFIMPHLDWLNHYRFFIQFLFFLFGSMFFLIITHSVNTRETSSTRALAAFTALLSSTPNLMAVTDSTRRVVYLSNEMLRFIGYPRKEYTFGQPLIDLIADWKLKMLFADVLDAEGFYETDIALDVEGETRYFKFISDRLKGEFDGIFIEISDITPIVQSKLAAEEANKGKSRFLATMSHEIRTPMNAILGIAQIQLQKKEDLPSDYVEALGKIHSSGENLLGIINDILDMTKVETGKMELNSCEYSVASLINDTIQLNIVRIGSKPIKFCLDIDEGLPTKMIGDELRLKQILNNLLSNAIKYTEKGNVTLSVRTYEDLSLDTTLVFKVSDTGQGMKPEDCEKLFTEYVRFNTEANYATEGTGIGLNITKRLVELMEGTIEVESEYGVGSTFTVKVKQKPVECEPIGSELAEQLRDFMFMSSEYDEKAQVSPIPMPYGRVLVVDDVNINLYVVKEMLAPYLLNVEMVTSGFLAIEKAKSGTVYDIIFMDHMMPEMDGIETTKKLRKMGYEGAIIALTANAIIGNEEMFKQNGFDGYISKPIDVYQLNDYLNTYVRDCHLEEAALLASRGPRS